MPFDLKKLARVRAVSGSGSSGGGTGGSGGGGSIPSVSPKAVNFYDYDGTCLYAYTVEEAQALTEMPALPEREGLICQGWNWSLEDVKAHNRAVNVGATYITDDGTTRIYITLHEGRTSPMLGVCPNGTVTVDWGDGTEPDVLTGTSTSTVKWTPNHNYADPGDYVIRLTVDGEMGFSGQSDFNGYLSNLLRCTTTKDGRNFVYARAIDKIEIGEGVKEISANSFSSCKWLRTISIPQNVNIIKGYAFNRCENLKAIILPNNTKLNGSNIFEYCKKLDTVVLSSVTNLNYNYTFQYCESLKNVALPNGTTAVGYYVFAHNYAIRMVDLPHTLKNVGQYAFSYCYGLNKVRLPDGIIFDGSTVFYMAEILTSVEFLGNVNKIVSEVFGSCYACRLYDFTKCTAVPTLSSTSAFSSIPSDCEIRVPAALYDEWIAATNWATYASYIKAV